jgi:hypothetical protein
VLTEEIALRIGQQRRAFFGRHLHHALLQLLRVRIVTSPRTVVVSPGRTTVGASSERLRRTALAAETAKLPRTRTCRPHPTPDVTRSHDALGVYGERHLRRRTVRGTGRTAQPSHELPKLWKRRLLRRADVSTIARVGLGFEQP